MSGASSGIAALISRQGKMLEARIEAALDEVPTDAALQEKFTDAKDRRKVRIRCAIGAILDAVYQHHNDSYPVNADGTTDVILNGESVWSLLAAARLDFLHDQALLNVGRPAEVVLCPVGRATVDDAKGITHARETMILGLVLIEVWKASDSRLFKNQTDVRTSVANCLKMKPGAIKTQRSNFANNKWCSAPEHKYYSETIQFVRKLANSGDLSPFALLLPAFRARCEMSYPRTTSAAT